VLIGIDGKDGIVKMDANSEDVILKLESLGKLVRNSGLEHHQQLMLLPKEEAKPEDGVWSPGYNPTSPGYNTTNPSYVRASLGYEPVGMDIGSDEGDQNDHNSPHWKRRVRHRDSE